MRHAPGLLLTLGMQAGEAPLACRPARPVVLQSLCLSRMWRMRALLVLRAQATKAELRPTAWPCHKLADGLMLIRTATCREYSCLRASWRAPMRLGWTGSACKRRPCQHAPTQRTWRLTMPVQAPIGHAECLDQHCEAAGRAPGDAEAAGGEHERACGQVRPAGGATARGAARDQGRRGDHANQQERAARDEVVAYVPLQHCRHLVRLHARRRHLLEGPGHVFGV